jgi:hypothetical protein
MSERWKIAEFSKCKACPYARCIAAYPRYYIGCGKTEPPRSFDYGTNPFDPQEIPDWCPLPDAPGGVTRKPDPSVKAPEPEKVETFG